MTILYSSDFESETSSAAPVGWTAAPNLRAFTWSERGVAAIGGLKGVFASDNGGGGIYTGIAASTDQGARLAFRMPDLTTSGMRTWAILLRSNSTKSLNYRVYLQTDGVALRLVAAHYNAGSSVIASSATYSFTPAPGDLIHLEAFAVGTSISGRAWIEGTSRPETITGSGTATAAYATVAATHSGIASGHHGITHNGPTGSWFGADNVVFTDGAGGEDFFYSGADVAAPTLGSPTATPTGPTTATGSVTTDEANGTLFRITSTNATETGPTLIASGAQTTVTATGVQNITATGLPANTANLRHHFVHRDTAGNVSNVVSSAAFSTPAAGDTTPPTLGAVTAAATAPTVITGSVSTNEAGGALYRRVSANATESEATMEAGGLFQSVTATGVQNVTAAAPAGTNGLRLHLMHVDASGNKSAVVSSATFNTPAVPVAGVTSTPFKNGTGALQTGLSGLKIAVLPLAMNAVTKATTGTTDATTAVNVVSDSALVAGTKYVHVALSADDTIVSAEILTAA